MSRAKKNVQGQQVAREVGVIEKPEAPPVKPPSSPFPTVNIKKAGKVSKLVIKDHESLLSLLQVLPNIDEPIPQIDEDKRLDRNAAIAHEKKLAQLAKLPFSLYVKNIQGGQLEIQDLGLIMKHQQVLDLSSVPASQLLKSRDLRICLDQNFVMFVSKEDHESWKVEYQHEIENLAGESRSVAGAGLEVYGS